MKKNVIAYLLVSMALIFTVRAQAQTCTVQKSSVCNDGECKSMQTSNTQITMNKNQLQRCDEKGCDKYSISVTKSGLFTNVQIPNTSYMLKYDQSLNFIEATSFALTLIVNTGKCSN